ncbi:hypothetical protein IF1G_05430 [Cordyceps javanica]|uniref:Uncharacterized protein n=1 Tax=Cordyceps javanica TaxID=43265 RepID=A0A545V1J7_9HYPO|nr:hypothetical protein IF1G_05430 [Cordyceps javanica]
MFLNPFYFSLGWCNRRQRASSFTFTGDSPATAHESQATGKKRSEPATVLAPGKSTAHLGRQIWFHLKLIAAKAKSHVGGAPDLLISPGESTQAKSSANSRSLALSRMRSALGSGTGGFGWHLVLTGKGGGFDKPACMAAQCFEGLGFPITRAATETLKWHVRSGTSACMEPAEEMMA